MTKKVKNNIFKEKEFIIGLIILIILVLTPEIISKYNSYTSIKINKRTYDYYKIATDIYNDSKTRINNICLINKSNDYKTYSLNKKYIKHEDSKIINKIVCDEIGTDIIVYSKFEVLQKKDEIKNNDPFIVYYAQLDTLYKNQINETQYESALKDTKHEKIYNNLLSLHKTLNKENFKSVNIKRLNAKQEMLNNYNQKLKYEINELQFQNDTIKYFEQILNN